MKYITGSKTRGLSPLPVLHRSEKGYNYRAVSKVTGIDFINKPALMFDPYSALRAKAAFYGVQQMVPLIQAGSYKSAAGIYYAGNPRFRSSYTRNVAADTLKWIPVFKA